MSTCHASASTDFEVVLSKTDRNLEVRRCSSCGFAYLGRWRESRSSADESYDHYAEIGEADLTRRHTLENRARQLELIDGLQRHAPERRLLDVGCGDGQLLDTAGDAGWASMGIGLSRPRSISVGSKI